MVKNVYVVRKNHMQGHVAHQVSMYLKLCHQPSTLGLELLTDVSISCIGSTCLFWCFCAGTIVLSSQELAILMYSCSNFQATSRIEPGCKWGLGILRTFID